MAGTENMLSNLIRIQRARAPDDIRRPDLFLSENSVFRQKRGKDRAFAKSRKVCPAGSEFPQGIGISFFWDIGHGAQRKIPKSFSAVAKRTMGLL